VTARSESVVGVGGVGVGVGAVVPLPPLPPPQPQIRVQSSAHISPRRLDCVICISGLRQSWTPNASSESSRLIGLVRYIASFQAIKWLDSPCIDCNQSPNIVRGNQGSIPNHPSSHHAPRNAALELHFLQALHIAGEINRRLSRFGAAAAQAL
jgi:hypothetical protein